jgi:hypothetical protein
LGAEFVGAADVQPVVDGESAATGRRLTQPRSLPLCGDGRSIGCDDADAVSAVLRTSYRFIGGRIMSHAVDAAGAPVVDLERKFHALLARD